MLRIFVLLILLISPSLSYAEIKDYFWNKKFNEWNTDYNREIYFVEKHAFSLGYQYLRVQQAGRASRASNIHALSFEYLNVSWNTPLELSVGLGHRDRRRKAHFMLAALAKPSLFAFGEAWNLRIAAIVGFSFLLQEVRDQQYFFPIGAEISINPFFIGSRMGFKLALDFTWLPGFKGARRVRGAFDYWSLGISLQFSWYSL